MTRLPALFLTLAATAQPAWAHGGQYRGPGDFKPPEPTTSGAPPATAPPASGAAAPPVAKPRGAAPPRAVGAVPGAARGGYALDVDAAQWQIWWAFNKDPYIRLKEAVHNADLFPGVFGARAPVLKPTAAQIHDDVLPALRRMLATEQRDMVSGALIALGKAGVNHKGFNILELMAEKLRSGDQEVRETAALAMGISQMPEAVDRFLVGLVLDDERGRRLVQGDSVDYRTRSFAAYALGLIAWSANTAVKQTCFEALDAVLADPDLVSRDLKVAAVEAIGLIRPSPADSAQRRLLERCLHRLESYYRMDLGVGDQLIQAHAPPAIARLLGRDGPQVLVGYYKELFLAELRQGRRESNDIARSAALALGQLASSDDDDVADYRTALLRIYRDSRDRQSRYFSLMALGQIGGSENRDALLRVFREANDALSRSWAALALGVHARSTYAAQERAGLAPDVDRVIGETLHRSIMERKNPEVLSALAIALGLCEYRDAADDLRDLLFRHTHQDDLAGYICVGLGLMRDRRSQRDISEIVTKAVRRPELLRQGAVALGLLGDKDVADLLRTMLVDGGQNLAKMSAVASALGLVGDRRAVSPLIELMFEESMTDLSRAFAAVALGGVADKENLPWNSKLASHINYRAAVETLATGAGTGILEIL